MWCPRAEKVSAAGRLDGVCVGGCKGEKKLTADEADARSDGEDLKTQNSAMSTGKEEEKQ